MGRIVIVFALALSCCMTVVAQNAAPSPTANPAPNFSLDGGAGKVELAAFRGQVVLVDFWASWCVPCKHSFPFMNAMQAKYGPQGLRIVGVNVDSKRQDAERFLAATPASFTVAFDATGATPRAFGIKGMPTSFLLDRKGNIVHVHPGFHEGDQVKIEQQIVLALKGGGA